MAAALSIGRSTQRSTATPPRVLFVSHEASRTGAPMMFLHFLRWLKANTDIDFEILLLAGGPLTDDFAAVAPLTHIEALGSGPRSYLEAGLARAGFPHTGDKLKVARSRQAVRHLKGFDALYLNSTTSCMALRMLPEIPPVVISHLHELDSAFRYWFPENQREAMLQHTTRYVTCAEAVSKNLIGGWRVPSADVACHYEFIVPPTPEPGGAARAKAELGIPADASIIGGAGSVIWRKGPDLFLQVAATIRRRRPDLDVHFVWVGGTTDERMPTEVDVTHMGISERVHFVGEVARPDDLYSAYDVFALTSREDPYPLVMLEAASLGVPVVSFANGGAVEFGGSTAAAERRAVIVDYLDVEAMAEALISLVENEGERRALGRRGQHHVLENHTVDVAATGLHAELEAALAGEPPTRPAIAPLETKRRRPAATGPTRPMTFGRPASTAAVHRPTTPVVDVTDPVPTDEAPSPSGSPIGTTVGSTRDVSAELTIDELDPRKTLQ